MFARIRWELTNQTADEGADKLTLLLTYSNMSLVQEIDLPGNSEQVALDLIPGTNYTIRLRAENPDGMRITGPVRFATLPGSTYIHLHYYFCNVTKYDICVVIIISSGVRVLLFLYAHDSGLDACMWFMSRSRSNRG